jgi:Abnormal spindle-like microcephaly-assoc'd, ASPM-SPD-2-Hydin
MGIEGIRPLQVFRSRRYFITSLLIVSGVALLTGCQGVAPSGSQGVSSALVGSPSALAFGDVQTGKTSSLSETLTNTGGSSVTISSTSISSAAFSVSGINLPVTLSPNQRVTFTATFAPASDGSTNATLAVTSTADSSPLNIALSGTGTSAGQLSVSPTSLNFGNVVVGSTSSLNGTLRATGSSVTITSASINSNEFALSGISLPTTLSDGQKASFTVTFQPAASGTASATLTFSSDAGNSPTKQALTGTGTAATSHWVDLTWDSPGSGVVGYNVYRGNKSGGPYSQINSALDASTSYTDNAVTAGKTYYYVTTAVDGSGNESGYSNQAQAVIPNP